MLLICRIFLLFYIVFVLGFGAIAFSLSDGVAVDVVAVVVTLLFLSLLLLLFLLMFYG